ALGAGGGAGTEGRLVVGNQAECAVERRSRLGPAIELVQERAMARQRERAIRDQVRRLAVGLERVLEVARERGQMPAPKRFPILLEEWPAHVGEPTAVIPAAVTAGGTGLLPLGVLRRLSGTLEAVPLALLHPRVAGEQPGLAELEPMRLRIELEEGPGDPVANRTR